MRNNPIYIYIFFEIQTKVEEATGLGIHHQNYIGFIKYL